MALLLCSSELATMTCNEGETLSPALTIHGLYKIQRGILQPGEMIYVPPGWSYQVKVKKGAGKTITIGEAKLHPQAIEEADLKVVNKNFINSAVTGGNRYWTNQALQNDNSTKISQVDLVIIIRTTEAYFLST